MFANKPEVSLSKRQSQSAMDWQSGSAGAAGGITRKQPAHFCSATSHHRWWMMKFPTAKVDSSGLGSVTLIACVGKYHSVNR